MDNIDWLQYERITSEKGFKNICGVDEAGRGPLAGPVCAAAVILKPNQIIEGVNDSKKLSEKKEKRFLTLLKMKFQRTQSPSLQLRK